MRLKTWLVAAIGLGSLVVLIAVSMLASSRKAEAIYTQLDQLNSHHRRVEDDAVGTHEVRSDRSRHHNERDRRLDRVAPCQKGEQAGQERGDHDAEADHEHGAAS